MVGRGQGAKPKRAKTHEENRVETCCCCGGKVIARSGCKKITAISPKKAKQITDWAHGDWDPSVLSHPLGLCQVCNTRLSECATKKKYRPGIKETWDSFQLQSIFIPRGQLAETCRCDICLARRSFSKKKPKVLPRGVPESNPSVPQDKEESICPRCLQVKGRGIRHKDCGPGARKRNLAALVLGEGSGAEQVASAVLKAISDTKSAEPGQELQLRQLKGGNALTVNVKKKKKPQRKIMVKSLTVAKIKKKLKLSKRATEKVCQILRQDDVTVESNTRQFLAELDSLLKPHYENKKMVMEVKVTCKVIKTVRKRNGQLGKKLVEVRKVIKKEKEVAIVKNTSTFLEKIAEMCNFSPENALYRVCQDGGGGSFKSMDQKIDPTKEDKDELPSGVNQLLAFAVAPGVPESHFSSSSSRL